MKYDSSWKSLHLGLGISEKRNKELSVEVSQVIDPMMSGIWNRNMAYEATAGIPKTIQEAYLVGIMLGGYLEKKSSESKLSDK